MRIPWNPQESYRVPVGMGKRCGTPAGMEQNCAGFPWECNPIMEHFQQQKLVFKLLKNVCSEFTDKTVLPVLSVNDNIASKNNLFFHYSWGHILSIAIQSTWNGNVTSVRGTLHPGFEELRQDGEGRDFAKVMPPRHWTLSLTRQPIRAASTDADFPTIGPRARWRIGVGKCEWAAEVMGPSRSRVCVEVHIWVRIGMCELYASELAWH